MEVGKTYYREHDQEPSGKRKYKCVGMKTNGDFILERLDHQEWLTTIHPAMIRDVYHEYQEPRSKTVPVFLNEYATGLQVDTFFSTNSPRTIARKTITITEGEGM